jgi:hypothetical protein
LLAVAEARTGLQSGMEQQLASLPSYLYIHAA